MAKMKLEELRKERRRLAHKKRRLLWNNDGDDFPAKTEKDFLAMRCEGFQDQVETISYCPIPHGFAMVTHNSKVCDYIVHGSYEGVDHYIRAKRSYPYVVDKLIAAPDGWNHPSHFMDGKDVLEIVLDFCREHDLEMWTTIRMNDKHDLNLPDTRSPWKAEHPERWLAPPPKLGGGIEERAFTVLQDYITKRWPARDSCMTWYSVNYERQDVRDKMYDTIAEICQNYDIDGLELDFLRRPLYFQANARGNPDAGQENRDKMTELVRRIRKMTEDVGMKRGRPIIVSTRIPDDAGLAKALGLDTLVWIEEKLVDILVGGSHYRIHPWKNLVELGHSHDMPVYASAIEQGAPPEVHRGRALAAWASGVDGIYSFNIFNPNQLRHLEADDPERLMKLDRTTTVENARLCRDHVNHIELLAEPERFLDRPTRLPLALREGEESTLEFAAGEDGERLAASATPHTVLRLLFHFIEDDELSVGLNGHSLDGVESSRDCPKPGWISWRLDPSWLRWGDNFVTVKLEKRADKVWGELALADLELAVTAEPEVFASTVPENLSDPRPVEELVAAGALEKVAFVLTEDDILPPPGRINALRQWLLDELDTARGDTRGAQEWVEDYYDYPPDPLENALPGWDSAAVLFDTDELGNPLERDITLTFLEAMDPGKLKSEVGFHVGYVGGTEFLAAVLVRSQSTDDLCAVVQQFGPGSGVKGLVPLPIRFLRAETDGHLIPRTFSILFRGTLKDGVFDQEKEGRWEKNLLRADDLTNTAWRLAT